MALAAGLVFLAGCPASEPPLERSTPTPTSVPGGTLVFGVIGEPRTLSVRSPLASDLTRTLSELQGSFRIAQRTPGLEVVYARDPKGGAREPLLDRVVVRFVQTLDIAVELLASGRLDAAALPGTVNLVERLHARGLNSASGLGQEVVYLDMRGADLGVSERTALAALADVPSLERAFVGALGRPTATLHPRAGQKGAQGSFGHQAVAEVSGAGRRIQLAAPVGDEFLGLVQRALHDDWERQGFEVDVVTIDARTFYGEWAAAPRVDVALRRGNASHLPPDRKAFESMSTVPLFQMSSVVAWREGVHGLTAPDAGSGPLIDAARWWMDAG